MNAVTVERLTKLIEFMESLPPEADGHFNMRSWIGHSDAKDHYPHLSDGDVVTMDKLLTCGTTACALGWATAMPYFRELGLRAEISCGGSSVDMFFNGDIIGSDHTGELFDLREEQSCALFGANNKDATPKAWAARARDLLADWNSVE